MIFRWLFLILVLTTIVAFSCNSVSTEKGELAESEDRTVEPNQPEEENNPLMESESFRQLAAFLPKSVKGVKGGRLEGWAPGITAGVKHTMVKRTYRDLKNKTRIDLSIVDAGSETLRALGLVTYWLGKKVDKKTKDGYERNAIFGKYAAFEKCGKSYCDVYFATGNRFLIGGHIENLPLEKLYEDFQKIDIAKIEQLPIHKVAAPLKER